MFELATVDLSSKFIIDVAIVHSDHRHRSFRNITGAGVDDEEEGVSTQKNET